MNMEIIVDMEIIAKVAHEANRAYCQTLGDNSQPTWEDAPDWQKNSAMNGIKFHLENPGSDPADSHENWMAEKLANGWKYGAIKNSEIKEHPCLVPYEQLPIEQQVKDAIFSNIVKAFAKG